MKQLKDTLTKEDRNFASLTLLGKVKKNNETISRILDSGSRDGALLRKAGELFDSNQLLSIDWHNRVDNGVEFCSHNLENLLPFSDKYFDLVICNDVLEHIELKKQLFNELLRISGRYLVISLPNTQHWTYIRGLIRGRMSKQYNFLVEDGVDRHRWITYYNQNIEFIINNLGSSHSIFGVINTVPTRRVPLWFAKLFKKYFVFNQVFLLERH
ncbi:class I SAM-dependent methyltransferase [Burkholderiales bacterium]|nr:class I SAM-dependent methyltransferase [Burkholderiales bacterium]